MFNLIDTHCDTIIEMMDKNQELFDNNLHVSIKKLMKFNSPIQFFAICLAHKKLDDYYNSYKKHVELYYKELEKNKDYIQHANTYTKILENMENNKITGILTIEGAEVLEDSIEKLEESYKLGVRSVAITWNHNNAWGHSCTDSENRGLTILGKDMLKKMNELGMIIDVSHLSERGFYDVCELSAGPFIASHSNSYEISPHRRNLKDDQLKALKETKSVTGLNLCAPFLNLTQKPTLDDCIHHLDKMLNIAGEDSVGLGCDLDGIQTPEFELCDVSKMDILHDRCLTAFGKNITEKIFYKNFMRVLSDILA
ncbi:MAG: dipeptidase [Defluviitaleaceae bacterium]|nr:dipeptidase [Defluviitaleaceae bacterium]